MQDYREPNSLVFQTNIWLNETENNTMKIHLYQMLKIDARGTLQWRLTLIIFLELFGDVQKMVLQYCENIQQLTFQYLTQYIGEARSKITLCKKCPYSKLLWSVFFHIPTEYGSE